MVPAAVGISTRLRRPACDQARDTPRHRGSGGDHAIEDDDVVVGLQREVETRFTFEGDVDGHLRPSEPGADSLASTEYVFDDQHPHLWLLPAH